MASFHQVPILRFTIHQVNSDSPQNQASFLMKNILHAFHLQPLYNTTSTSDVVILHPLSSCLYVIEILFLSTYFSSSSYFWIHKTSIISFIFFKSQQSFGSITFIQRMICWATPSSPPPMPWYTLKHAPRPGTTLIFKECRLLGSDDKLFIHSKNCTDLIKHWVFLSSARVPHNSRLTPKWKDNHWLLISITVFSTPIKPHPSLLFSNGKELMMNYSH